MLLRGARPTEAGVYVPEPAAELVLFVIRKSLDYAVASEALIPREWKTAADELRWLMSQGATDQDVRRLLAEYLPSVDFAPFREPERDPGTQPARVAQGVAHAAGRDASASAPLRGRGHRGGRLGRFREVHGGGGGEPVAGGVPVGRDRPWRQAPSVGADRSPAP